MRFLCRRAFARLAHDEAGHKGVEQILFERPACFGTRQQAGVGRGEPAGPTMQIAQPAYFERRRPHDPAEPWQRDESSGQHLEMAGQWEQSAAIDAVPPTRRSCRPHMQPFAPAVENDVVGSQSHATPDQMRRRMERKVDQRRVGSKGAICDPRQRLVAAKKPHIRQVDLGQQRVEFLAAGQDEAHICAADTCRIFVVVGEGAHTAAQHRAPSGGRTARPPAIVLPRAPLARLPQQLTIADMQAMRYANSAAGRSDGRCGGLWSARGARRSDAEGDLRTAPGTPPRNVRAPRNRIG